MAHSNKFLNKGWIIQVEFPSIGEIFFVQLLRSGEGVRLSGDPVDVVIVEAPREAARGAATDLRILFKWKRIRKSLRCSLTHWISGEKYKTWSVRYPVPSIIPQSKHR